MERLRLKTVDLNFALISIVVISQNFAAKSDSLRVQTDDFRQHDARLVEQGAPLLQDGWGKILSELTKVQHAVAAYIVCFGANRSEVGFLSGYPKPRNIFFQKILGCRKLRA